MTTRIAALALLATTLTACDTTNQVWTHTTNSTTAPISEVRVELDSGTVQVTSGGQGQVKSGAVARWNGDKPQVDFIEEGTLLRIVSICGRAESCTVDLAFEMPPQATLNVVGDATTVMVKDLRGPSTIKTGKGNVELTAVSGTFDVSVREGKITGTELGAERATAQTMTGAISLDFAGAPFHAWAETVNGDISMVVPTMDYLVEAKSGDGAVKARVPQSATARRLLHAIAVESGNVSLVARDMPWVPDLPVAQPTPEVPKVPELPVSAAPLER